jgi:hypothetical protein
LKRWTASFRSIPEKMVGTENEPRASPIADLTTRIFFGHCPSAGGNALQSQRLSHNHTQHRVPRSKPKALDPHRIIHLHSFYNSFYARTRVCSARESSISRISPEHVNNGCDTATISLQTGKLKYLGCIWLFEALAAQKATKV